MRRLCFNSNMVRLRAVAKTALFCNKRGFFSELQIEFPSMFNDTILLGDRRPFIISHLADFYLFFGNSKRQGTSEVFTSTTFYKKLSVLIRSSPITSLSNQRASRLLNIIKLSSSSFIIFFA